MLSEILFRGHQEIFFRIMRDKKKRVVKYDQQMGPHVIGGQELNKNG